MAAQKKDMSTDTQTERQMTERLFSLVIKTKVVQIVKQTRTQNDSMTE